MGASKFKETEPLGFIEVAFASVCDPEQLSIHAGPDL
jgi:hypothetical protein